MNPIHLHEDYHQAKLRSVGVLLSIHAFEEAYDLSIRFHCFLGVMNSVWSSRSSVTTSIRSKPSHFNLLLPQLHRKLTDSSSLYGVIDPFPTVMEFGRFCLEWLEQHSRYQEILDLGRYTPHQLQEFLKVTHHLFLLSPCPPPPCDSRDHTLHGFKIFLKGNFLMLRNRQVCIAPVR